MMTASHDPTASAEPGAAAEIPIADRLDDLDGLEHRPLSEHVAVYGDLHTALHDALSDIDRG
ncbi:MAG: hypothetical protein ACRDVG_12830 [Jatrophihabitantaceae bacterium]